MIISVLLEIKKKLARRWWRTPLIPVLRRQRQANLSDLEASLVYRASSRTARATQRNPVSKKKKKKKEGRKEGRKKEKKKKEGKRKLETPSVSPNRSMVKYLGLQPHNVKY